MSRMAAAVNQTNQVTKHKSNAGKIQRQHAADCDVAEDHLQLGRLYVFIYRRKQNQIELRNYGVRCREASN